MTTRCGAAISYNRNPKKAATEATTQALQRAGITKPSFVFLFATVGYDQKLIVKTVGELTHHAPLSGCSGEGVITNGHIDESNFALGVLTIESDEIQFTNGYEVGLREDCRAVGERVGKAVTNQPHTDNSALFVFADGLTLNFNAFVAGLEANLDRHLPLFGGTAGDNWQMKQTYQYCNDTVVSDGIVWTVLGGNLRLAWGVNHGCIPIGLERTVTKAEKNVIYEIDHKPALDVLKEYLLPEEVDNWTKAVVNLCLGFKAPDYMKQEYDQLVIRFMPAKDDQEGSVTIPTEVAPGTSIWMTRRDYDKISQGIIKIAADIKQQMKDEEPKMVFQFDCAGRGKSLFREQQKQELLDTLQSKIGPTIPWLGFNTFGEIGPYGQTNHFHNYTVVLLAIY